MPTLPGNKRGPPPPPLPERTSIKSQDEAQNHSIPEPRLPVELWEEILGYATKLPDKNEYAEGGEFYGVTERNPRSTSSLLSSSELANLIRTRSAITRVCSIWNAIGTPILYGHIRIIYGITIDALGHLQDKLYRTPYLAEKAKRLTITIKEAPDQGATYDSLQKFSARIHVSLLPLLPNIRILACSECFWRGGTSTLSTIIVEPVYGNFAWPFTTTWDSITTLVLRTSSTSTSYPKKPYLLPNLESLGVMTTNAQLISYITKYWKTPLLRNVYITGEKPEEWCKFLRKCGSTLQQLDISMLHLWDDNIGEIDLPFLSRLSVTNFEAEKWINIIYAPQLAKLTIYEFDPITLGIVERAEELSTQITVKFPRLEDVEFCPRDYKTSQEITVQDGILPGQILTTYEPSAVVQMGEPLRRVWRKPTLLNLGGE